MTTTQGNPNPEIEDARLIALYQGILSKWIASRALLWQFPALTLTAQAFLIGAATQLRGSSLIVELLLVLAIGAIALGSILLQLTSGIEQHLELVLLDRLETALVPTRPDLRLYHSLHMDQREHTILPMLSTSERQQYLRSFETRGSLPLAKLRKNIIWASMQVLVASVGATIALVG